MDALSEQAIRDTLSGRDVGVFGAEIHYFAQTQSTNDIARSLANNKAVAGTLIITDHQTAGRGRMGRVWETPPESCLLMSLIFRPTIPPDHLNRLVMVCGLGIAEACESQTKLSVDVKWPNDLLIGGKKFTGILPESAIIGEKLSWVVVGMGINVNFKFEPDNPLYATATTLQTETRSPLDRLVLLKDILTGINRWHDHLTDISLVDAWRDRCVTIGRRVRVTDSQGSSEGLGESLTESGALVFRDDAGRVRTVYSGEATLRGSA